MWDRRRVRTADRCRGTKTPRPVFPMMLHPDRSTTSSVPIAFQCDHVHGELPFKQRLAVQTIRDSGFASGNSQGWRVEELGRPLSPRVCLRIALGVNAPTCRTL